MGLVGPNGALQIFGVKLVGFTADNGRKLLFTVAFLSLLWLLSKLLGGISRVTLARARGGRLDFWARQFIRIAVTVLLVVGLVSIWFDDPGRAGTALGLFTAGLAFALQRVVTAVAGYLMILRGGTFNVGDRIKMGGVRGDVIGVGFLQTTIMEMGQPPSVQQEDPGMWVEARQYTGRIVSVTNDKIFDEPVYNFTRDFPYIWEEIKLPVSYGSDRKRAEEILLDAARRHTVKISEISKDAARELQRRYFMSTPDLEPRVFYRMTDNWLELALRFVAPERGVRELKDKMFRDILQALEQAGIGVASATFEIVGLPPLRIERVPAARQ